MSQSEPQAPQPLVSICVPTYNAEATIEATIFSILNQNYKNLHVVVVDNASNDATLEIVSSFRDPRLEIFCNSVNIGAEGNFTRCISLGRGKYTAIFHADDIYEPDMVNQEVAFLEMYHRAGAVFTGANRIDSSGRIIGVYPMPSKFRNGDIPRFYEFRDIFSGILRFSNFILTPSVMVRTEIYQNEIKAWNGDQFVSSADLDVWLRIALKYPIGIIPNRLMRYRVSSDQGTHSLIRMRTSRADIFRVLDHYLDTSETAFLNATDYKRYAALLRTDQVVRAMNYFLLGHSTEAINLSQDVFTRDAIYASFKDSRALQTFLLAIFLRLMINTKTERVGKYIILRLRAMISR